MTRITLPEGYPILGLGTLQGISIDTVEVEFDADKETVAEHLIASNLGDLVPLLNDDEHCFSPATGEKIPVTIEEEVQTPKKKK